MMERFARRGLSAMLALTMVISLFAGLGVPIAKASTQQYNVIASQDNFVRKTVSSPDYSNMINGGDGANKPQYLNVKEATREAYLQFDLSNYPEHITSATLYLYGRNSETAPNTVTAKVYGVNTPNADNWNEGTITWNTKPSLGNNVIGSMTFPPNLSGSAWASLDVTAFIQSELTANKIATFAVAGSNALIRLESHTTSVNDTTGQKAKPYLVINGTPALKAVTLQSDASSIGLGQTTNLTQMGMLDTNMPANLSGATVQYSSDSPHIVIDNPSVGVARAVSNGTATITASVTLEGVTKTAAILLTADGAAPAEVTNLSGSLVNGVYTLTWADPADADYAGVSIYNGSTLLGTVAKGNAAFQAVNLNAGQSYTLTLKTTDLAGNLSTGTSYTFVYEDLNILKEVILSPSTDMVKPGQTVSFTVSGKMKDGSTADLSQANVTYVSNSGSLAFASAGNSVANAVYAGPANIKAIVKLDGITQESSPVLVRVYPVAQDQYDELRLKYVQKLTGYDPDDSYDVKDPDINLIIRSLDGDAKNYWDSLNKTTYTWADLTSTTKSVELATASSRLRAMSKAWATYGSVYYQNEALVHDIIESWDRFNATRYNENIAMYDNWFDWRVNVPNNINDSMILLYETIPYSAHPDLIDKLNRGIDKFDPSASYTGANRVYISKAIILRGITGKNSSRIQMGSGGLTDVFPNVKSGDGFYDDGSFIQHDYFPYAGGYGKALLQDITDTLWLVSGSEWDNEDPQKSNIFDWYFEAFDPNMYKGQIINAIDGREISREYTFLGYGIVNALLTQVELAGNPFVERQKSAIKYHIENASVRSFLSTSTIWSMQKAKKILNDPTVQAYTPPSGNFNFYNQDNVVHRGNDWLYSISMHSDRIANYETVSNENLKGWYEADGMTQLYLDPLDYLSLFWTTVDPSRLPGITVDRDVNRPAATSANRPYVDISKFAGDGELMTNSWTGGVSMDREYGTAGMDFKQHNYSDMDVSAKKSWFMFDDEIVALGAGITSSSDRPIETIVDNRPLNASGDNALTVNGTVNPTPMGQQANLDDTQWIHLEGTGGYVFPGGTDVQMLREEREGKSKDINEKFFFPGYDEFNSVNRATNWSWLREDRTHYALTGSELQITSQQGTLRESANSTPNLFQTAAPKEDFYLTTSLDFSPTQQGQEAGIIIRKDDDNYVSVAKGMTAQGNRIIAINEVGGIAQADDFPIPAAVTGDVFLKIDKSGDQYTVYASNSEASWGEPLYTFTNPLAGTDRLNMGVKMGLYAQSGTGTDMEALAGFDFFHIWHTRNYMTLWLNHDVRPHDAAYSYIQLPKKDAADVAAYSVTPDVTILSNTSDVQAATDTTLGITGMNFWKRGILGSVKANDPSSLMVKEAGNELQLSVSDPTHKQDKISFEIKKQGIGVISKDSTVTVLQLSPTIKFEVDTTVDPGKTHNVSFTLDPSTEVADFTVPVLASAEFDAKFRVVGIGSSAVPVLTAILDDQGAVDLSQAGVSYSSSNETVAVADSAGTITAIRPGTAEIEAVVDLNGVTKSAKVQVLVPSANPTVTTRFPGKDTFIRSGIYQEDTYGNDTKLYVKNAGGDDFREAYFTFDLSGIAGEIESVKFHAIGKLEDTGGTFVDTVVKPVLNSWDEASAKYTNKPSLGQAISGENRFTNIEADKSYDITEFAREQLRNGSTLDLALVQEVLVGRKMFVYSSENTNKQPYLEVVTHTYDGTVHDAAINPILANFDKNVGSAEFKDIAIAVSLNGNRLESISDGSTTLVEGRDYSVVGNRVTLKKAYLVAQLLGSLALKFEFSAGADVSLVVTITDTTPLPSAGGDDPDEESGSEPSPQTTPVKPSESNSLLVNDTDGVKVTVAGETETRSDGTKITKLQVGTETLSQAFEMIEGQKTQQTITIQVDAEHAGMSVVLPASAIAQAANNTPLAAISIQAGKYGYVLPVNAIHLADAAKSLGSDIKDLNIVVSVVQVDDTERKAIEDSSRVAGVKLLAAPVDFHVSVEGNGKTQVIDNFGSMYISRSVVIDGSVNIDQTTVLLYDPATGSMTFVPATFKVKDGQTTVTIIRNGNSIYTIAETNTSFTDLAQHWAKADIEQLAAKMIVNGLSKDVFVPDQRMTRAEFVTLLVRGLGLTEDRSASHFADISNDDWFVGSVGAAVKADLIDGFEDGTFQPEGTLTREQLAVLMVRAMAAVNGIAKASVNSEHTLNQFTDRNTISSWAVTSVGEALNMNIMSGMTATAFQPPTEASRAQAAVMLKRVLQKLGFMNE
ncbi:polysaccharide lyase family 8 super-sandwich domain-containing protein [Paenibacillus sp. Soil750]|uniref:polysaccharide lyase family 8 super-sandwich domain-containing protein n=1 Tax=Paenibacillus sp. Soil750 TaxID=1736398 RepID=UPI0009EC779E|nr:polysaccharide lyase family 8 super-sandwich domain-containing protein [Paenibacillus sp. Soil750]